MLGSITSSRSKGVKLASCHIHISNEILLLTKTAELSNSSRVGTAESTTSSHHSSSNRNHCSPPLAVVVVVVEVLAQTRHLTTNVTRYHLDLQECVSSQNTLDNTTVCTTTLLFPWESYYNTGNSSTVPRSQLHLLLVLQPKEAFTSAIILDEAHFLQPKHNDLLPPIQLTASYIPKGDNSELLVLSTHSQDMDMTTTPHDSTVVGNCLRAQNRVTTTTTTNIAIVLFILLLPLLPVLLVLFIAYEPSHVRSYAQLLLQTAYHCFYPVPYHDEDYYYHFHSYATNTSQNATNVDPTPASYVLPQDRTSPGHGTNENVSILPPISTSPSFITSPPMVIRQPFYDAPTENNIIKKVSSNSSQKHTRNTPSKIALSSLLPTHLRKRKKHEIIITKPNCTKTITTSSTHHHTNDRSKHYNNKNHYIGSLRRKRLKLFNSSNDKKELWTLHDDLSCQNTFAFI